MTITTRKKELIESLAVIAIGAFFLSQAKMIENFGNDPLGPQLVPTILSWLMIGIGGLSAIYRMIFPAPEGAAGSKITSASLLWIGIVTGYGLIYLFLFLAVGYLLATIVMLGAVLITFGVRRPVRVVSISVLGGLAYYFVFMRLMMVYDPPGWLIDISTFLRL